MKQGKKAQSKLKTRTSNTHCQGDPLRKQWGLIEIRMTKQVNKEINQNKKIKN